MKIVMQLNFQFLLPFCILTLTTFAQEAQPPSLNIGDPAPPLRVRTWLKGEPIRRFEKGRVYVVEFWATWCKPCKAAIPHLNALASEFKDQVTIIGMDIYEKKSTTIQKVKAFVDSMGHRMDYHVAAEDSNFMSVGWLEAFGEKDIGIPRTFVVNADGNVAWIGHPSRLGEVLPKIVNNEWRIKEVSARRNLQKYLTQLDDSLNFEFARYSGDPEKGDLGKPDSTLLMITEIIRNEPNLKYAPHITDQTFCSLLKTNPSKAYKFGKEALTIPSLFDDPPFDMISSSVKWYSGKLNLPAEIYLLGAEAYQVGIDRYPWVDDYSKTYNIMAEWYCRAKDKSKAIETEQKAIEELKRSSNFSARDLAEFESRLEQYKKM